MPFGVTAHDLGQERRQRRVGRLEAAQPRQLAHADHHGQRQGQAAHHRPRNHLRRAPQSHRTGGKEQGARHHYDGSRRSQDLWRG